MAQAISQMTAAGSLAGTELVEVAKLSTSVTITATTISAQASDNSFNDSGSGLVAAGFAVGDRVRVQGFTGDTANNMFSALVTTLTAGKMVIGGTDGDVIVDDAAGESVTITKWETRRTTVDDILALGGAGAGTELRGLTFTADTGSTADSDPGAGLFKWNNATQGSATVLYIDEATADAVSIDTAMASLSAGTLQIQQGNDAARWQRWAYSATPVDGTGYWRLTVTLQAKGTDIQDGEVCFFDFDDEGAAGSGGTSGKHAIYIAAGSITPSATGGCAALATIASAANQPDIQTLDFDASTQEYAQFGIVMPKSWNEGTVTFKAHWSHASTTTNFGVVWDLQAVAVGDDDAIATAFGTAQTSTDTGGTTNDLYNSPESSAITVAGSPGAEEMVFFRLSRVTGDGSDTMAIDARLHGITVYITTDAETDA